MFKANITKIIFSSLMMTLFVFSPLSYADWSVGLSLGSPGYYHDNYRYYRWHDHPHYGYHLHHLPDGYFTIWAGGARYYYYDGLYYSYVGNGDYVMVNPPIGAHVDVIPPDFVPVIINGKTYYTNNGVYYILTEHHGYKVVPAPIVYAQPATTVIATQDSFPVNVPTNNGGYITVMIKKSGNGFVGPQGEFYPEFPKVSQLKVMYGK